MYTTGLAGNGTWLMFFWLAVAIVVGGLTTFVLVLLVIRPVVRLRKAARELAMGKLNARVPWPKSQARIFAGDER